MAAADPGRARLKAEDTQEAFVRPGLDCRRRSRRTRIRRVRSRSWTPPGRATTADRDALIAAFFDGVLDVTVAKVKLAAIAAGLSPAAHQAAVDARFAYVQPELETFLVRTQQEASSIRRWRRFFRSMCRRPPRCCSACA